MKTRSKRFELWRRCIFGVACALLLTPASWAATGDVYFSTPEQFVLRDPGAVVPIDGVADVFVYVAGAASVQADAWALLASITAQGGSSGSVQFNPPPIVNDEPNLGPASVNPFLDFDRDFGGMSYGALGDTSAEIQAFGLYFAPQNGPAPPVDANGNITLPDGAGLVALPISISASASGDFEISFDVDPEFTGVSYLTGLPEPNDVELHPAGVHVPGILHVVVGITGDMDCDGDVDFDDIDDFVQGLSDPAGYQASQGIPAALKGDTDSDADLDFDDIPGFVSILSNPVTASVPEPATFALVVLALTGFLARAAGKAKPAAK